MIIVDGDLYWLVSNKLKVYQTTTLKEKSYYPLHKDYRFNKNTYTREHALILHEVFSKPCGD